MKAHFAFGKNGIDVEVPEGFDCQVVRSRAAHALNDVAGVLEAALDHPIHSEPLEKLAMVGLKSELLFYTPGAARDALGSLGAHAFTDMNQAIAALFSGLAPEARVALLPEGPYTFARAMPAYA